MTMSAWQTGICKQEDDLIEKTVDQTHQVLSEKYISLQDNKMSVLSDLFAVRAGGDRKIRRLQGRASCYVESDPLQSVFQGGI